MSTDAQVRVGAFLRKKRESLTPELIGLARGARSRTPGLRREDVAELARISAVWYSKIERGKAGRVSRELLLTLMEGLRLDESERRYVMTLAGMDVATVTHRDPCLRVSKETQRVLDRLDPLPAVLLNGYFDIVGWNAAYETMSGLPLSGLPAEARNSIALLLTDPAWRTFQGADDDARLRALLGRMTGTLRGYAAARPRDPDLAARIDRFCALSPVFVECWESQTVARPEETPFTFQHAVLGPIVLRKQIWVNSNGEASGRLNVYHPCDDGDLDRLTALSAARPPSPGA